MGIRHRSVLVALCAAALLAGCADAGDDGSTPGGSMSPSSASPSGSSASPGGSPTPSISPSRLRPSSAAATPAPPGGQLTVTGDVVEGVEPNCVLLRTGDKLYLLLGGDRALIAANRRLTVTGTPQPGLMTTCQQGTPFQVTTVRAA